MTSNDIYSLYTITNKINEKVYVGITKCVETRWKRHKKGAVKNQANQAIHFAISKHNVENFQFSVIYQSKDFEHIKHMESVFIDDLKCVSSGYNRHPGGHARVWTPEEKITLGKSRLLENNPNWKSGKGPSKGHLQGIPKPNQSKVMKSLPRENGKIKKHPPIKINDIVYPTLKDAIEKTGYSYYVIHTRIKSGQFQIVE
jgi:group I intron endonuclease